MMQYLQNRYSLRFWPSKFVNRTLYDSPIFITLFAITDLIYSYIVVFPAILIVLLILSYVAFAQIWIKWLRDNIDKWKSPPWKYIRLYKEQQVINHLANAVFSDKMVPYMLFAGITVFVVGFSTVVRPQESSSIVVILNAALSVSILFCAYQFLLESGGRIVHFSADIKAIGSIKFKCAVDRLGIKGCREIRMYIGSTMYFKSTSFASFAQTVLDRLVDFLLVTWT
ncbi:unnamed protein product [Orchesella dallaii]|uniref:Uncharacterized protein n=1 Tax=Orchesella dallaii TaxID=48710 RepID=A0ABP1R631_9HEXA